MKNLLLSACCLLSVISNGQNSSLLFNGSTQYLEIPDHNDLDLSSNFTIEGWIYPTGTGSQPTEGGMIINKEYSYEIARFADGTFRYAISANGTGSDWGWYNTSLSAPLNRWTHFAMVKSGTTVTFYVNGTTSNVNGSIPATMAANTQTLRIGHRGATSHYFNGYIDEIRIWNTVQTQTSIKKNAFNRNLSVAAAGLVAYYRMNEGSGSSTANSCTNTTGINATLINAPAWSGSPVQFAYNAVGFDGTDDNISVPSASSLNITTAITIEAWCYATKNSGIQNVICKSSNATNTGYIFPRTDDGWNNFIIYLHIGGGWQTLSAPYPSLNAWHHLAATYDGANIRLYVNGTQVASRPQTGVIATNGNALTLGNQPGFAEYFGGRIDEARIWNVARSQAQLQSNMTKEIDPATQTGLVTYYSFNQGIATGTNTGLTTLLDLTGNNNGTFNSFSMSGTVSNYLLQYTSLFTLPVTWNSFTGNINHEDAVLKWSTSGEWNTGSYTIYHSTNGQHWTNIGIVAAAGNSSTLTHYQFRHATPSAGINYYKIGQVDTDGRISFSKIITLTFTQKDHPVTLYPNPVVNGILHIKLVAPATVYIYNMPGQLVLKKTLGAGLHSLRVHQLEKGVYQLKTNTTSIQFVIQ